MAVTVEQDTIKMTAADDEVTIPLVVHSVRFVAEAGQLAADEIVLVDPVTDGELWRTFGGSATATEAELISAAVPHTSHWRNGVKVGTMTGNRGLVYVRYQ